MFILINLAQVNRECSKIEVQISKMVQKHVKHVQQSVNFIKLQIPCIRVLTVAWIKFEQVKYLVLKLFKKSNNQKGKPLFFFFFFFFLGGGVEHNKVVIQCLRLLSDCFCLEFFFIHAISFCLELKRSGHGKGSSNNYLLKRWWLVVDIY